MKIKVAAYIANFLAEHGIDHNFTVTGGGAMHLNDALGHHADIKSIYNHHEQASAMAAEAYARIAGKPACLCVTSGPGGTNAITGVLGAWLDSIPMLVFSGQVKFETTIAASDVPLRQLGDQEFNIVSSISSMTKYAHMITEASEIRYHLEKMMYLATHGRKGPVWLDVPLNIQGTIVETDGLKGFDPSELPALEQPVYDKSLTSKILASLAKAKRPVIYAGHGIRLGGAYEEFHAFLEKCKIPVVTAWNAHDVIYDEHPCACGRPGTVGTRGGNFVVENSDWLLVLGCRLNIRQISYNYKDFAPKAYKIMVDIDENELKKPTLSINLPIHADVKDVLEELCQHDFAVTEAQEKWLGWCKDIERKYPAALEEYCQKSKPMNPYAFMEKFFKRLSEDEIVVCGNGSAGVMAFQAGERKHYQRWIANSGCAAMGYGFPAALGCAVAADGKRIVCIDGDGSFQMNLQELQTVVYNKLNIKLFYLNNNGYHSIRQTQTNLFQPPLVGVCDGNGLSFPDAEKIAAAYGLKYVKIDSLDQVEEQVDEVFSVEGAVFCEVVVDPAQNFAPKLSSKRLPDGRIVSPPIDDMFPFLPRDEYAANKNVDVE